MGWMALALALALTLAYFHTTLLQSISLQSTGHYLPLYLPLAGPLLSEVVSMLDMVL